MTIFDHLNLELCNRDKSSFVNSVRLRQRHVQDYIILEWLNLLQAEVMTHHHLAFTHVIGVVKPKTEQHEEIWGLSLVEGPSPFVQSCVGIKYVMYRKSIKGLQTLHQTTVTICNIIWRNALCYQSEWMLGKGWLWMCLDAELNRVKYTHVNVSKWEPAVFYIGLTGG